MRTKLRVSPSGPMAMAADLAPNPQLGQFLTRDANGQLLWDVPPLPPPVPPPPFVMRPMYQIRVLDFSTTTPLAEQNGTFQSPYGTMGQCIADLPTGGTVLIVPNNYGYDAWHFTHTGTLTLINLAGLWNDVYGNPDQYVVAPGFQSDNGGIVLQGIACSAGILVAVQNIWAKYSSFSGVIDCGSLICDSCTFDSQAKLTATGAENDFTNCFFNRLGLLMTVPSAPKFRDTRFSAANSIVISGGGGSLIFDQASFNSWAENQCTTNGTYLPVGNPLSGIVETGPNAALAPGRSLLTSVPVTGAYDQPAVIANFAGAVPPAGVLLDAHYTAVGPAVEIYITNYTGAPLAYPASDVRWRILAP
jgi:hypothetical protein